MKKQKLILTLMLVVTATMSVFADGETKHGTCAASLVETILCALGCC
jgi:hypothetical protein